MKKSISPPNLQFNVRSFHPKKDFGWSGLMFEGDNRGFSNQPSNKAAITSRIWHRFTLDTHNGLIVDKTTHSDPSRAPWAKKYRTYDGKLAPKGSIMSVKKSRSKSGNYQLQVNGNYGGVNHAMPGSPELQKSVGTSYVPTLNVNYEIRVDIDIINQHIDVVTYVTGDGFPNCEAFVIDSKGQSVFLGIHVRKGAAPVSLGMNLKYPMIAGAIRLPIDTNGNFKGNVGDEWARKQKKSTMINFESIQTWNQRFLSSNPDHRHCMLLERFSVDGCFSDLRETIGI